MKPVAAVLALAGLAATAGGWPQPAAAATSCTASATPLAFGTVSGASPVDTAATVTVSCSTFGVTLLSVIRLRMCLNIGAGTAGEGRHAPRQLVNPHGDRLAFQIYRDPARSQVWGDSASAEAPIPLETTFEYTVLVLGGANTLTLPMYGRIPAQSGLAAGSYANAFTGAHTRLDYRYNEPILGAPPFPASCTGGGTGGGSITFPFSAQAAVPHRCTLSSATDLAFGTVAGRVAQPVDQASTLTFTCTGRTPWNVALDTGLYASGGTRRMRREGGGEHYVAYELYRDPARTLRWGAVPGSDTATGTGTGTGGAQSVTVYGRVPAIQVVPAGDYRDTVTVTVSY
ncbi:Csu type fimbrial protein [Luteimonas huabeiensis]|uniref:Csu type fimbrial protein n=1 Tax=Luteimonas huabeiensis TaxID=1244513 RepID=UPI0004ACEDED|nr:spore coat U domain-containing protein [Luteimonas huabeiensis]